MLFCFRSLNPKAICWSGWDAPQILPTPKNSGYGGHLFSCQDLYDFLCSIGCKNIHDTETLDSHQILKRQSLIHTEKKSSSLLPILDALQKYQLAVGLRFSLPFTGWFVIVLFVFITINVYGL
jgi:hypothetical protein